MANASRVLASVTPGFMAMVKIQDRHIIAIYSGRSDPTFGWQHWEVYAKHGDKPVTEIEYRRERT